MEQDWWKSFFDNHYLSFQLGRPWQNTLQELNFLESLLGGTEGRLLLDACCGQGRHAVPLANEGWRVVGLDYSSALLEKADLESRKSGTPNSSNPAWVRADLRAAPFDAVFDAAICMFTSLGYCEQESDHPAMIASIHQALKPEGVFILDLANRDYLVQHPDATRTWWQAEDSFFLEETRFNPATSQATTRTRRIDPDGRTEVCEYRIRLFSLHEIANILFQIGFMIEGAYGSYLKDPPVPGAPRLILLCRKIELTIPE